MTSIRPAVADRRGPLADVLQEALLMERVSDLRCFLRSGSAGRKNDADPEQRGREEIPATQHCRGRMLVRERSHRRILACVPPRIGFPRSESKPTLGA